MWMLFYVQTWWIHKATERRDLNNRNKLCTILKCLISLIRKTRQECGSIWILSLLKAIMKFNWKLVIMVFEAKIALTHCWNPNFEFFKRKTPQWIIDISTETWINYNISYRASSNVWLQVQFIFTRFVFQTIKTSPEKKTKTLSIKTV